ncbi:DUF262 domain-containing protein [Blautia sp. Sow4_E7]|uniref:DUF262 domain-containing protein n=1 Tax=Blautia sp. Sow4_E7 TaxID=3438749 RepID=UPI003F9167EF
MGFQIDDSIVDYLEAVKEAEKNYVGIEGIDVEDGDTNIGGAYNINDIRIEQKMLTVYQIENWINSGMLNLHPEYRRSLVWNTQKKTSFIESILLRLPLSAFWLDEDETGYKNVMDGMQRLNTIHEFIQNGFCLQKMHYLTGCDNMIFGELPPIYQSYILETILAVNILDERCPQPIKFDIFQRMNSCGVKLSSQEIRNGMAKPLVRQLLDEMSSCEEFRKAIGGNIKNVRMETQELCLRVITFLYHFDWVHRRFLNYYGLQKTMDNMIIELNLYYIQNDYQRILNDFKMAMRQAHIILKNDNFSKPGKRWVNASLFTSWAVALINIKPSDEWIKKHADEIYASYRKKLEEKTAFYHAVTASTGSKQNILTALEAIRKILERII